MSNPLATLFSPITVIWNSLIFVPTFNLLLVINQFTHNLGWSILILSGLLRAALIPVTAKSLKIQKLTQDLAPELARLKAEHKDNKQALASAQAELYKKHGLNPAAGCLPTVVLFAVMFALSKSVNYLFPPPNYNVSRDQINQSIVFSHLKFTDSTSFNPHFFYTNLSHPDVVKTDFLPLPLPGLFVLLSTALQFISMKMSAPALAEQKQLAEKTPGATDDSMAEAMSASVNWMPLMNIVIGYQFPSVIMLYFLPFTALQIFQQYRASGWGGLQPWISKIKPLK